MNFKLTRWKVIVSLIVAIFHYGYLYLKELSLCAVKDCVSPLPVCEGAGILHDAPSILPHCCTSCIDLIESLGEIGLVLLLGILVYGIWSLLEKKKEMKI